MEPLAIDVVLVDVEPRRASTIVHMAARIAIGVRLGVYPTLVLIEREPSGRPVVEGVSVSFGHSGGLGVVAIADPGHAVGVDIEVVRPRRHLDRIARRIFAADELEAWTVLDEPARLPALLGRWTEVEALLKAQGTGVAGGFGRAVPWPNGWARAPIDAGAGFVGSVAAEVPGITVRTRFLHKS